MDAKAYHGLCHVNQQETPCSVFVTNLKQQIANPRETSKLINEVLHVEVSTKGKANGGGSIMATPMPARWVSLGMVCTNRWRVNYQRVEYLIARSRTRRRRFSSFQLLAILSLWSSISWSQQSDIAYVLGKVPAETEHRMALVIGNSSYTIDPLTNPVSDAEDIAKALSDVGFAVTLKRNLTRPDFVSSIAAFGGKLTSDDTAVFYYAGHAVQVNGRNYLVPVDAQGNRIDDVENEMADIDLLMDQLRRAKPRRNIVILDACRDNPWLRANGWFAGLAPPTGAPVETVVAYATDPGNVAKDGEIGKHSPYTRALLKYIRQPGLSLDDLFKDITASVRDNTDNLQNPWVNVSLREPFFFRDQAYVVGRLLGADDDAVILLNGEESLSWNQNGSSSKKLPLNSGDNILVIKVYNQRTFTGGVDLSDLNPSLPPGPGHLPEGWNYYFNLCNASDLKCDCVSGRSGNIDGCFRFSGGEDHPTKDGPHHGKLFSVAKAVIHVYDQSGEIVLKNVDDTLWRRSSSLLPAQIPPSVMKGSTAPSDEVQGDINWCIGNHTTDIGETNCPGEYLRTEPNCIQGGGRACLLAKAIASAKANDCSSAFQLTLICQCHNPEAQKKIAETGEDAVCNFLRTK